MAVLSFRDAPSQTGTLVKVQRWNGNCMYGKTTELDLAWLKATGVYWNASMCPFDDDIPF